MQKILKKFIEPAGNTALGLILIGGALLLKFPYLLQQVGWGLVLLGSIRFAFRSH